MKQHLKIIVVALALVAATTCVYAYIMVTAPARQDSDATQIERAPGSDSNAEPRWEVTPTPIDPDIEVPRVDTVDGPDFENC